VRALILALIAIAGCNSSFPPYSHIHSLSVLAMTADPPEVAIGASSTVSVTAFDPAGGAFTIDWAACTLAPPIGTGADVNPQCITATTGDFLIPLGSGPSATVTMPSLQPTDLGVPDDSDGFYLPVRAIVQASGAQVTAIYRLRLDLGDPPNHNPNLVAILRGGDDMNGMGTPVNDGDVVHPGDAIQLAASLGPGSVEDYFVIDLASLMPVMRTETLRTSWFATQGTFSEEHTSVDRPDTTLTLDGNTPAGPLDLWSVVRDERGGTSVLHRTLMVQ
jgi:hypothetical protein